MDFLAAPILQLLMTCSQRPFPEFELLESNRMQYRQRNPPSYLRPCRCFRTIGMVAVPAIQGRLGSFVAVSRISSSLAVLARSSRFRPGVGQSASSIQSHRPPSSSLDSSASSPALPPHSNSPGVSREVSRDSSIWIFIHNTQNYIRTTTKKRCREDNFTWNVSRTSQ